LLRRAQNTGKPPVVTQIRTLEQWSKTQGWPEQALAYDARVAAERARMLREEERQQASEDVKVLLGALRGATALAAVILSQYVDKDGNLVRQADAKDAAALLRVALAGRRWVDASSDEPEEPEQPPCYEVEEVLRQGNEEQRIAVLQALRQLEAALQDCQEPRDSAQRRR
jgi:hypothetical protein